MYRAVMVDDEPFMLEGMRTMINWAACGFTLCGEAASAQEALHLVDSLQPHLLITDVRMPGMNGMEATGRIRRLARPDAESVPIIALTGDAIQADKEAQLEAGMNVSLSKPVEPRLLYKTILELTRK